MKLSKCWKLISNSIYSNLSLQTTGKQSKKGVYLAQEKKKIKEREGLTDTSFWGEKKKYFWYYNPLLSNAVIGWKRKTTRYLYIEHTSVTNAIKKKNRRRKSHITKTHRFVFTLTQRYIKFLIYFWWPDAVSK